MADEANEREDAVAPVQHTASPAGKDRRREPRHKIDTSAVIRLIDIAALVRGRIVNVSFGGCCIRTIQRFPVGVYRRVEIEFYVDGLPFRLGGVIQGIHDPFSVGIRFLNVSARKREQLAQLIEEIKELRKRARETTDD